MICHATVNSSSNQLLFPQPSSAQTLSLCHRGRDDKTGYEPRGLFNVVEFVMNDKKGNGFISLEEAMQVRLHSQNGRPRWQSALYCCF